MTLREIEIGPADTRWHPAFMRYVSRVFPGISFEQWVRLGGWDDSYRCFALTDGEEIAANTSLSRMDVLVEGRAHAALQLGAVGVAPEHRGRGLLRPIMARVLASVQHDALLYLFANTEVLGLYPKFGFRRVQEHVFGLEREVVPGGPTLRRLELTSAADRQLLKQLCATTRPVTTRFGARDYGSTVLWYWANFYPNGLCYAEHEQTIVVAEHEAHVLRICDVISPEPVDLQSLLPRIATRRAKRVELAFGPEANSSLNATPVRPYEDCRLFVRGPWQLPPTSFKHPQLAQA